VIRAEEGLGVSFVVSDLKSAQVTIEFEGILPDMFREGQGIIALGQLTDKGVFVAEEVLAKHDENYMPPEVADALKNEHQSSAETYNKANYN
ncbi:MAG: cytochrome c biogenesis protein CcmE, partial [Gammaproteobacteria bacterium]|nr:cytochrome c biogenesis protein CcmE [Gammaproteobacteria bacterium]